MPYKIKGQCVYKKDTNAKVGCTKGDVNKYLSALYSNVSESKDKLAGGLSDDKTISDIVKFHKLPDDELVLSNLTKGVKIELEHVNDVNLAKEIAKDHLMEFPDYYDRLEKLENEAKKTWTNVKEFISFKLNSLILEYGEVVSDNQQALNYDIYYHDRPTGNITISPVDGSPSDDSTSILNFKVVKGEKPLAVITNAITNLFTLHKTLNHIYVPTNPYNRLFWEKAGASRFKDGIHVFNR